MSMSEIARILKLELAFIFTDFHLKADIVVFLVNHKQFAELNYRTDIEVLDFCGMLKK